MKKIPIALPFLGKEEAKEAYDTILSGWVTQGPKVAEFETKFAEYVGSEYAIAVSNCTTALHLSMIVSGIKEGDEVICPSMSYIATANSIRYVNATPIFAEVDNDYNLNLNDTKAKITSKTKAVLLVHQMGMPANIKKFQKLCDEHNLVLIEDAACSIGSSINEKKIGSHSDLVCFSFHPRKVITTGDGGMVTTSNPKFSEKLKLLRQHGMSVNDRVRHESEKVIFEEYSELGYNYRMTDIQASVGIHQLAKLDTIVRERRKIAFKYIKELKKYDFIKLPIEPEGIFSNYQAFPIYLNKSCPISRNNFMQLLLDVGISTRRGIMNAHREPAYKHMHLHSLPISEDLADNSLLLPLYHPMSDEDINYVLSNISKIIDSNY